VRGTKGFTNAGNTIFNADGTERWKYEYPVSADGKQMTSVKVSPYVQEHIDLVTAIRTNNPYVEGEQTAIATMAAIMGRISAYTGKEVTWDEMMESNMKLGPEELKLGPVNIEKSVAVPGEA
jgi:hypothetical protein